jgi:hypothetical protein
MASMCQSGGVETPLRRRPCRKLAQSVWISPRTFFTRTAPTSAVRWSSAASCREASCLSSSPVSRPACGARGMRRRASLGASAAGDGARCAADPAGVRQAVREAQQERRDRFRSDLRGGSAPWHALRYSCDRSLVPARSRSLPEHSDHSGREFGDRSSAGDAALVPWLLGCRSAKNLLVNVLAGLCLREETLAASACQTLTVRDEAMGGSRIAAAANPVGIDLSTSLKTTPLHLKANMLTI